MTIPNQFKYNSQNYRLLQALKYGPVNTCQLLYDLKFGSPSSRKSEVQKYLETIGYTIIKKSIGNRCYEYRISPLPEKVSWWEYLKSIFSQRAEA
ncbi:MAG: hypothetical protein KKE05_03530 [Nanoarchaeota archaeon]|nr:hypothetical protein [Nanoarchaeota archaeon]